MGWQGMQATCQVYSQCHTGRSNKLRNQYLVTKQRKLLTVTMVEWTKETVYQPAYQPVFQPLDMLIARNKH